MSEDEINFCLKVGTYDSESCVCYNDMNEVEADYTHGHTIALSPKELKRLLNAAYCLGSEKERIARETEA